MICVSVMLAVFLGWPLAFGGGEEGGYRPQIVAANPAAAAQPREDAETAQADDAVAAGNMSGLVEGEAPESCYKRYQREVRACPGSVDGAACRLKAADEWDMCEAKGFWAE
jgi:hypothetical protein